MNEVKECEVYILYMFDILQDMIRQELQYKCRTRIRFSRKYKTTSYIQYQSLDFMILHK